MSEKTWIDLMIEREALPRAARSESTEAFCLLHNIEKSSYYYQASKEEHQKKILEISLNRAKNELPEVLESLMTNAKAGKEKSIEMYLDYIIKLAKNLDIKSDGKPIIQLASEVATKYAIDPQSSNNS